MKIIGLTGGVGSGKSTIAKVMKENFQVHILIADSIGHQLMEKGNISYKKIVDFYGTDILNEQLDIDRRKLSDLVFDNKDQLKILNSFIHPYVKQYVVDEIKKIEEKETDGIVVVETAILFESGFHELCDEIWYVSTSEDIRRERLKQSRNYTDEKINSIFNNQLKEEDFLKFKPIMVTNNGDYENIVKQLQLLLVKEK